LETVTVVVSFQSTRVNVLVRVLIPSPGVVTGSGTIRTEDCEKRLRTIGPDRVVVVVRHVVFVIVVEYHT
jgi:hypothetical protein